MTKLRWLAAAIPLLLIACTGRVAIERQYAGSFESNIDSLKIGPGGIYERAVYTRGGQKIFSNKGRYTIEDDVITFDDFLLNEDDLSASRRYGPDDLLLAGMPYVRTFSGITIVSNDDLGYMYFKK